MPEPKRTEKCLWRLSNSHGFVWITSCGEDYDADDFGCSTIRSCPNCGRETTTQPEKEHQKQ